MVHDECSMVNAQCSMNNNQWLKMRLSESYQSLLRLPSVSILGEANVAHFFMNTNRTKEIFVCINEKNYICNDIPNNNQ